MLCQFLLYNKVNQLYAYIYLHIPSLLHLPPTLLIPPLQVVAKHQLISLCDAAASHQLSILHLVVYICQCHSLTSSQLNLPPPHVLKSILQRWMDLDSVIQSEVSQKEKNKYRMVTHIYGILKKNDSEEPRGRTGIKSYCDFDLHFLDDQ